MGGRPADFSTRLIHPNTIDLKQFKKLKAFKAATHKKALIGSFNAPDQLRQTLLRDLMSQVRKLKARRPAGPSDKLEQAAKITNLIRTHHRHNITPELFDAYSDHFLPPSRRSQTPKTTP